MNLYRKGIRPILFVLIVVPPYMPLLAETSKNAIIDRDRFTLSYPNTWEVEKDEEFGLDEMLMIDSDNGGHLTFLFGDVGADPEKNVRLDTNHWAKALEKPTFEDFTTYGAYKGFGRKVQGRFKKGTVQMTFRLFICSKCVVPFSVTEMYSDEGLKDSIQGFQIIEQSFKIKK